MEFLVGAGALEFFKVRIAVENFLMVRDSVILDPCIRIVEAIGKAADISLPVTDEKVEVVRAIALRKICGIGSCLREGQNWEYGADHDQREERDFAGFRHMPPFPGSQTLRDRLSLAELLTSPGS